MVLEVVMVEMVDVVRDEFSVLSRRSCLGDMMDVKVVIEDEAGVVVLMW